MCQQEPDAYGVRRTRWLVVRNHYPELMGTTVKDFRETFSGIHEFKSGGMEPPTARVGFRLEDGTIARSEVIFLALDREDAVAKIRGYQITGAWLSEAKELYKAVVDMLDLRCGRYPSAKEGVACTWFGMFGDTNAWDEDHWLYSLWEDPPKGWKFFDQPGGVTRGGLSSTGRVEWKLNPAAENTKHLPDGYYERGMAGKDDDWIAVNLANEFGFVIDGEPVWKAFSSEVHVPAEPIPYNPKLPLGIGIDFGRTPAAVFGQHDEAVGRICLIDEFLTDTEKRMSASIFGPELRRYVNETYPGAQVVSWGDPAGDRSGQTVEVTPIELIRSAGIPCQPAPLPDNNPLIRRTAVIDPLSRLAMDGAPALLISRSCKVLRKAAAGGFHYARVRTSGDARYHEQPDKNWYSHPAEAAEYLCLGFGEGLAALRPPDTGEPIQIYADGLDAW